MVMASSGPDRFVGRDVELGALRSELGAALAGEGRLVFLLGEPGIGKTRTALALAHAVEEQGADVTWGRCHEAQGAPVYWPWMQALKGLAGESLVDGAAEVAALLPALRSDALALTGESSPERARFELFDRIARTLSSAARRRPFAILLDDLHWADAGSLQLLEFLARELASTPLLVLATIREGELTGQSEKQERLASLLRLGRSIRLVGLSRDEVRALLADCLGRPPAGDVVDQVFAVSGGNPYLVTEVAHLLAARAPGDGRDRLLPAIPPGARELLRRRIEPLADASQRILRAGAVIGREFDLPLLAKALGETESAVLEGLAPARELGLVRELEGSLRRFSFAHALLRETLYADLATGFRTALHAACASALEAAGAEHDDRLSALAHHAFEAAEAGDAARAVRQGCAAGEQALGLLAFDEAVRHFERALAALDAASEAAERWRVLAGLGQALYGAGQRERANDVFQAAIAAARRAGPGCLAEAVLLFARARAEFTVIDVEMNELLEEALAGLSPEPSTLRALLLARLAAGLQLEPGEERRRRLLSDEATEMARKLADPGTLDFVLTRRLLGLLGPDQIEERLATTAEILGSGTASRAAELEALMTRIDGAAECGDRAALDQAFAAYQQKALPTRQPFFLWGVARCRTALALLEGRYAEAEAHAQEALRLGSQVLPHAPILEFAQQIFTLRGWQGRLDEVGPLVEGGVARTQVIPAWRCALAHYYSVAGRATEARREFEALAGEGFADLPRNGGWFMSMSLLAEVCWRLGDRRRAELLYRLMRPYAGRIALGRPLVVVVAPVDARLATLATLLEQHADAAAHFEDALTVADRMRALPWQAEIRYQQAELLRRRNARGDRERALELLDQAEEIASTVGMALLVGWIQERRAEVGRQAVVRAVSSGSGSVETYRAEGDNVVTLVPRSGSGAAPATRAGSFRREGGVWTLAFEGRTSQFRTMLGLAYIARLLAQPGREIHVAELVDTAYAGRREARTADVPPGDAGEQLDPRARAEYEERLRDAREELEEAQRLNDRGRSERLAEEVEFLAAELTRGYGLAGRARRAGSAQERARIAVTRAIKYALGKIEDHDPALAEHLRASVRTGTFCVYAPSSRDRVTWSL